MRILATICALQFVFILVLLRAVSAEPAAAPPAAAIASSPIRAADTRVQAASATLDAAAEARLRAVIREELQQQARDSRNEAFVAERQPPEPAPRISDEDQLRRERVAMTFAELESTGHASAAEMAAFGAEIAKLPPADRTEMLRRLNAAIRDGRLDAAM